MIDDPEPDRPAYNLDAWRRRIPLLARAVPLNSCSQGPQVDTTRAAAESFLRSWDERGMDWDAWIAEVEAARLAFARLINAHADDVAVVSSVSHAVSALASALRFDGSRRRVIVSGAEFPTVGHVWLAQRRRGAEIVWVPLERDGTIETAAYEAAIDERTLIVSACHGYYVNGFAQDVAAIVRVAHARGALAFVDAYQTLGTEPIDVEALDVDALAGGTLKYLMGTPGLAFLYVRRELAESLEPTATGWFGRAEPFAFDATSLTWAPGGRRFDAGTPAIVNAYVARAGLEIVHEVGPDRIAPWTRALSRRLIEGGDARGLPIHGARDVHRKAPTTAFVCGGDSAEVERRLRSRGVLAAARGPVIRLAPHFFNSVGDVDLALDALHEILVAERRAGARA